MESSVTRLLVATKMLLESLTKWSIGQRTESQVSDVYVRLGNDFGVAKVAFGSYGIDMSDLASVPDDLRDCLEQCLSEDASPAVLDVHLPRIRQIVVNLLQGLKAKQAEYKAVLHQSRSSSSKSSRQQQSAGGHLRRSSKLSQSESNRFTSERDDEYNPSTSDAQRSKSSGSGPTSSRGSVAVQKRSDSDTPPKRPTAAPPIDDITNPARGSTPAPQGLADGSASSLPMNREASDAASASSSGGHQHPAGPRKRKSTRDRLAAEGMQAASPSSLANESIDKSIEPTNTPAAAANDNSRTTDGLVRHSLVDAPATANKERLSATAATPLQSNRTSGSASRPLRKSPRGSSRDLIAAPLPAEGSAEEVADAADPSLRALKQRDALERRASKRFSAYTFNKMGVGLNQGFGMSSFNLGPNGAQSPMPDGRRESPSHSRVGSRRLQMLKGNESPDDLINKKNSVDYFAHRTPTGQKHHKAGTLSASDVIQEITSPDAGVGSEDEHARSKSHTFSNGTDNKGGTTKEEVEGQVNSPSDGRLAPPAVTGQHQQAMSSTESLPFVDAQGTSPTDHEAQDMPPIPSASLFGSQKAAMPPLPTPAERARLDAAQNASPAASRWLATSATGKKGEPFEESTPRASTFPPPDSSSAASHSNSLGVFLQLGRQTRRATLELDPSAPLGGLTIGKLRMLFMDRFTYSPGKDDFPAIYIKDVSSGVAYELENMADIGEGCVLTLNIEPLDQVKQHLDLSLGNISRELRELKAAVYERERESARAMTTNYGGSGAAAQLLPTTPSKISDAQFAMAGARVAQYKRQTMMPPRDEGTAAAANGNGSDPFAAPSSSTGTSTPNLGAGLKLQYEEVQNVRRELAILRQIQGDFHGDIGTLLSTLREQSAKVRAIAATELPTERNFIVAGKSRLDTSSQEVLTTVEDLLDTVDDLKLDVIQRGVKPKPATMKSIAQDIAKATKGLEDLEKYVETVKPSWKKTWESELQNIVDEQEFLNHQEGLIQDLREDHGALMEVFENISQVVKLRGVQRGVMMGGSSADERLLDRNGGLGGGAMIPGVAALRPYHPPPPEEGHEGLSTVMLEVKSQAVDHEKRLRALQAAERTRQREKAIKTDEFESALKGFVDGKALRKTGGHEEAERVRQKRDKLTIQAMFGGGGSGGAPAEVNILPPPKLTLGRQQQNAGSAGEEEEGAASDEAYDSQNGGGG